MYPIKNSLVYILNNKKDIYIRSSKTLINKKIKKNCTTPDVTLPYYRIHKNNVSNKI